MKSLIWMSLLCFSTSVIALPGEQAAEQPLTAERAKVLLAQGIEAARREQWQEAIEALSRVAQAQPDNFQAHYYLAMALSHARATYAAAATYLERASELARTESEKALLRRLIQQVRKTATLDEDVDKAIEMARRGQSAQALERMIAVAAEDPTRLLDLGSDDPALHVLAGRALSAAGSAELARQAFLQALALDVRYADARLGLGMLALGQSSERSAAAQFVAALAALDQQRASLLAALSSVEAAAGRFEQALRFSRDALAASPSSSAPLLAIAVSFLSQDRDQEATALLERTPGLQHRATASLIQLALAIREQKDAKSLFERLQWALTASTTGWHEQALPVWQELCERFPQNLFALTTLADVRRMQATDPVALRRLAESYHRILELDPQYSPALASLGRLALQINDLDLAGHAYRRLAEQEPDMASDVHYFLAHLYRKEGRLDEAIASYDKAAAVSPRAAEPLLEAAELLMDKHDYAAAVERARRAKKAAEDKPAQTQAQAADVLGWALFQQGKLEEAGDELINSLHLSPRASTHYRLAILYHKTGQSAKAIDQLQKALKRSQSSRERFPEAEHAKALLDELKAQQ